jgi:nitrite reductase/ring-hydroxylating ferredoxin subunit
MNSLVPLESSRREFLRTTLAASVFAVVGGVPKLIGEILPDDFKERGSQLMGIYTMRFSDFPVLRALNGSVRLAIPGAPLSLGQIIVTRYQENTFSALNEACPHEGQSVGNFSGGRFVCPLHVSVFGGDGRRISGLATRGMTSYPVTYKAGDDFLQIDIPGLTATSVSSDVQYSSGLSQNFPNPASGATVIEYTIAKECSVVIAIFSVLGKEVQELVRRDHDPGQYRINADVSHLNKGVYFYRMDTSIGFSQTRKLTIV